MELLKIDQVFFQMSVVGLVFSFSVAPYGWPKKSYSEGVPESQRGIFFTVVMVMYILPIIVSVIMYSLLYYKVKIKSNQVGVQQQTVESDMQFGGIYIGHSSPALLQRNRCLMKDWSDKVSYS